MSLNKNFNLKDLKDFIEKKLKKKITKDLLNINIIKEADLECCIYYHLRRFLKGDQRWKIFSRKHAKRTGRYIDLLIFKHKKPFIAIELKWDRKKISKKDLKSLKESIKKLKVKCAYFITTVATKSAKYKKLENDLCKITEIPIGLDFPKNKNDNKKFKAWKKKRKVYKNV
jgi:predicted helicase